MAEKPQLNLLPGWNSLEILDLCLIILLRARDPVLENPSRGRRKPMKHVVRIAVLMLALMGAYAYASVPQGPAPDGGVIILHP